MANKKLKEMFEEYNYKYFDELYGNDVEFTYLVNRYKRLGEEISKYEKEYVSNSLINRLKKHRMQIKDEAYSLVLSLKVKKEES